MLFASKFEQNQTFILGKMCTKNDQVSVHFISLIIATCLALCTNMSKFDLARGLFLTEKSELKGHFMIKNLLFDVCQRK